MAGRVTPDHPYRQCPHCTAPAPNLAAQPQGDGWWELVCIVCAHTAADWEPGMVAWEPREKPAVVAQEPPVEMAAWAQKWRAARKRAEDAA